jgi:hypothetical protein
MEIKYNFGNYSQEEAYQKIDNFLDGLVSQYSDMIANPSKKWNPEKNKMDFGFEAKGVGIIGNIKLLEGKLILDGKVPWIVAKLYGGKIEKMINENLDELFVKK